jgi:hypothetical protein
MLLAHWQKLSGAVNRSVRARDRISRMEGLGGGEGRILSLLKDILSSYI